MFLLIPFFAIKKTSHRVGKAFLFYFLICSRSQSVGLPNNMFQVIRGRFQISTNKSPQA